jgi:hypothetical protein
METRPVDWVMLVIEALILIFIVWEFVWKVKDWYSERLEGIRYETEVNGYLSQLDQEEEQAVSELVLDGKGLPSSILQRMLAENSKRLLTRDNFLGWNIAPKYKNYVRRWATERVKKQQTRK